MQPSLIILHQHELYIHSKERYSGWYSGRYSGRHPDPCQPQLYLNLDMRTSNGKEDNRQHLDGSRQQDTCLTRN